MLETIITGICGAGWLATLIMFFIQRHDTKKQADSEENKRLDKMEEALKKNRKHKVTVKTVFTASPAVLKAFEATETDTFASFAS